MDRNWLKLYDPDVPHTIEYPDQTLPDILQQTVDKFPNHKALRLYDTVLTYEQLYERVNSLAAAFKEKGVGKGDRVALLLPNSPTYVVAYYATLQLGAVVVNINVSFEGDELTRLVNHCDAEILVTLDLFLKNVTSIADQTSLKRILIHSVFGLEKESDAAWDKGEIEILANLMDAHPNSTIPKACQPDDLAVLQYTSGVTGDPKAVMLTHRSMVSNLYQIDSWNPEPSADNPAVLCIIPFFHVFGMAVCMNISILRAYEMVLFPRFDWSSIIEILNAIKEYKPISFPAVSPLWAALVSASETDQYDLSVIEVASGGGSALSIDVQQKYYDLTGRNISQAYGLSEASSTVAISPFRRGAISESVGIPLPDTDLKIVDPDDETKELKQGEIGEIIFKGPQMMSGYWKNDDLTAKTIRNGWLFTSDLGYKDTEGRLYIVDRKDEMIISRGYNIYPSEIESVLQTHPDIEEVAVTGTPDSLRGEAITAFIVLKEDTKADRKNLVSFCQNHLPEHKTPRFFKFREELPKNRLGKPLKRLLKQET